MISSIGFFGTYGAVSPLVKDDGTEQLETSLEVAAPVQFVQPDTGGDVIFFYPEIQFGGNGEYDIPEITEGTTVRVSMTLNLQNSDPFNIWTADIFTDSVDYYDGSDLQGINFAAWLDTGIEVTFGGNPVGNLNAVLSNDDESLFLAFDEVSGTGEFTVTMFYQAVADVPVVNPDGTGTPPGGMSFNYVEMNAASGDTTPGLWSIDEAGFWADGGSWGPGGLPSTTAPARYLDVITDDRTVIVDEEVVAAGITFDNANRYVLAGPGTVLIESDSGDSTVNVLQGQHEFQARVSLENDTALTTAGADNVIDFNNTVSFNGVTATISGPGTVNFNNRAQVESAAPVGDYGEDGVVNAADYVVWRNNEGTDFELPNRDPEATGDVGADDYDAWVENFGATGGGGADGTLVNHGQVGGSGRIAASLFNEMGGTVMPGRSAGTLLVAADFQQDGLSTLAIELGGTANGAFDVLDVGGSASIDGEIDIALIDGFTPSAGNVFDVLTAITITDNGVMLTGTSGFGFSIVAGGNGQVLRLALSGGTGSTAVPEPCTAWMCMLAVGTALLGRRTRRLVQWNYAPRTCVFVKSIACVGGLLLAASTAEAQSTLVDFSSNVLPEGVAEDILPDQIGISVAGLSTGTLNVINFPPVDGNDLLMFIPSREGIEDIFFDHTAGPGAPGDNPIIFSEGDFGALLFEDPTFPGFGVLYPLKVSSLWVARTFFAGTFGDVVGIYEGVEQWRVPVSAGPIEFVEGGPELTYVQIFTPQGAGDEVNELRFEGEFPVIDDITIGLTGLPVVPSSRTWIAGGFGFVEDAGAWSPSGAPNNTTDVTFDSFDSERLVITDAGLTAKSITFDGGETLLAGAGTVTLESNTNNPTFNLLSGDVEFQSRLTLADPLVMTLAEGSSVVFNNTVSLAGNDLTIMGDGDVTFNNQVHLAGGSISGSFTLGAGGALIVPEPAAGLLLVFCSCLVLSCRRRAIARR